MTINKNILFSLFVVGFYCKSSAQHVNSKPLITNESFKNWPNLTSNYHISNNGKFFYYVIEKQISDKDWQHNLVVESIDCSYKSEFQNFLGDAAFTENSRFFACKFGKDSLVIIDLRTKDAKFYPKAIAYKLAQSGKQDYLIYQSGHHVAIERLIEDHALLNIDATDFKLSPNGSDLIMKKHDSLLWYDLTSGQQHIIAIEKNIGELKFSKSGDKLAFVSQRNDRNRLWYYSKCFNTALMLVNENKEGIESGFRVSDSDFDFSPDGNHFYFNQVKNYHKRRDNSKLTDNVRINSYLQLWHNGDYAGDRDSLIFSSISLMDGKYRVVNLNSSRQLLDLNFVKRGNKYVLLKSRTNRIEEYWHGKSNFWLVSVETGKQVCINEKFITNNTYNLERYIKISPNEHFVIWYDNELRDIVSYEIATGVVRNLTKRINVPADLVYQLDGSESAKTERSPNEDGWTKDDKAFVISDKYDIWLIDPLCKSDPVCLTKGLGRKNSIQFRFSQSMQMTGLTFSQQILLVSMNERMENAIWTLKLNDSYKLTKVLEGACLFEWLSGSPIIKAKETNIYLVLKQSASKSANLYVLDLTRKQTFRKLTDIAPERNYNWVTSEYITYPMENGKRGRGILYKPENFDSSKKYPVIFNYYQERSFETHLFRLPESVSPANISVAWFVSNGYLVFMPDIINDEPAQITKNTVNAAESAVKYLSRYSWFDNERIGLEGQSFGGYETNILVANSKMFAAAVSVASVSDVISLAGSTKVFDGGRTEIFRGSALSFVEMGQNNMNTTVWKRPDLYIENSPVLQVQNITTPLLLSHGTDDGAVPYDQAYEFFQALRRERKKAWLLTYQGGNHVNQTESGAMLDFTIRVQQFFDYYLKDKPAPRWMLDNLEEGLQLDTEGRTP